MSHTKRAEHDRCTARTGIKCDNEACDVFGCLGLDHTDEVIRIDVSVMNDDNVVTVSEVEIGRLNDDMSDEEARDLLGH